MRIADAGVVPTGAQSIHEYPLRVIESAWTTVRVRNEIRHPAISACERSVTLRRSGGLGVVGLRVLGLAGFMV